MAAPLRYCTADSASTGRRCRRKPKPGERYCAWHLAHPESQEILAAPDMAQTEDVPAYSTNTNKHYPSWDALVAAEANGYVLVGKLEMPGEDVFRVAVVGPFETKTEAERARARHAARWRQEVKPYKVRTSVRICWKDR